MRFHFSMGESIFPTFTCGGNGGEWIKGPKKVGFNSTHSICKDLGGKKSVKGKKKRKKKGRATIFQHRHKCVCLIRSCKKLNAGVFNCLWHHQGLLPRAVRFSTHCLKSGARKRGERREGWTSGILGGLATHYRGVTVHDVTAIYSNISNNMNLVKKFQYFLSVVSESATIILYGFITHRVKYFKL